MALKAGARLGPYEVIAPIGAGGMGEVYRARDTRLQREVAIKVLPPEVSADPIRRRRFEVEARAVAALSHPHICPIHDVGAEAGLDYLVLELVHGETLAARLKQGPMPLATVLPRAIEMADAMATAHRRGIIHRDLKPGNVMLTKSGAVILDFGLARIVRDEPALPADSAQTATAPLTEMGVVLGTLQYMAPEQIEGRPADARTDVFAFGAILFEMLTARRAFEGSSAPAVMGAILRADAPSAAASQPELPPSVDRLIRACLAKDPADRVASMQDVKLALGWIQEDLNRHAPAGPVGTASPPRARVPRLAIAAAAALLLGTAGYLYGRWSTPVAPRSASYVYNIPLPPLQRFWEGLSLSPDGRRLALVTQAPSGSPSEDPRLWIRDLDSTAAWQLVSGAGDEVPHYPFWSPDGRSLAFFLMGRLVRVEPPSVAPIEICSAEDGRGGVWMDDTTIVFAPSPTSGLMQVDVRTGRVEELVPRAAGELGLKYPSAAGSRRVIYWANASNNAENELRIVSLDDPKHPLPITKGRAAGVYDHGTLFYLRSGLWVGQPFDVETARLSGQPKPVVVDRPWSGNIGAPMLSAQAGHIAASSLGRQLVQPTWMDRTGRVLATLGEADALSDPEISPDGTRVAVARIGQSEDAGDIWILDLETGGQRRITTAAIAGSPVWSGDSKRLAFRSQIGVGGNNNLYEVDVDAAQVPRALVGAAANLSPVGWLPDGARFVFRSVAGASFPVGILIHEPNSAKPTPFRVGGEESWYASLSPDATRIAYGEQGFGGRDLFVDSIPRPGVQPVRVSHGPSLTPHWSADGRELFFVEGNHLMVASVSDGPVLKVGTPVRLFDVPSSAYAVDPKTGRFLVMVPTVTPAPSVTVTLNWPR